MKSGAWQLLGRASRRGIAHQHTFRSLVTMPMPVAITSRPTLMNLGTIQCFHNSACMLAPKGKKGGKGGKGSSDEDDGQAQATLPDMKGIERIMDDKVSRLIDEFSRIRGGRSSSDIFKDVRVDAFGSKVPLAEVGQIALPTPTKMTITTFDSALAVPGISHSYFSALFVATV